MEPSKLLTFQDCEKLLKKARGNDKPLGGGMRLEYIGARFDSDDGYMELSYNSPGWSPYRIVRIFRDNSYAVSDGGFPSKTIVTKLAQYSPLGWVKPYLRAGTIYFGSPIGRYSLHGDSSKWVTLKRNGTEFKVIGAGEPDPKAAQEWTKRILFLYAEFATEWILSQGSFISNMKRDSSLTVNDMAEYIIAGEPEETVVEALLTYKIDNAKLRKLGHEIDQYEVRDAAYAKIDDFSTTEATRLRDAMAKTRDSVRKQIHRGLKSIAKDLLPLVTEYVAANGMPDWTK